MDIELLINKYIDGELSEKEDAQLRKMIAENGELKSRFDMAVETQYLISKDASSISVPAALRKQSEEAVLARIMGRTRQLEEEKRRRVVPFYYRWAGYSAAAGIALFALIFGIDSFNSDSDANLADSFVPQSSMVELSKKNIPSVSLPISMDMDQPSSTYTDSDDRSGNINISSSTQTSESLGQSGDNGSAGITENSSGSSAQQFDAVIPDNDKLEDVLAEENDYTVEEEVDNTKDLNSSYQEIERKGKPVAPISGQLKNGPMLSPDIEYGNNIDQALLSSQEEYGIILSPIFGSDFYSMSAFENKEKLGNLGFSIGYKVTEDHIVGAEGGRYNVIVNQNLIRNGLSDPSDPTSTPIQIPYTQQFDLGQAWGGLYYEYRYEIAEGLSFGPRAGLGYGSYGPLYYGRLQGRYELFDGVGMYLGTEFRGMHYLHIVDSPLGFYGTAAFISGIDVTL